MAASRVFALLRSSGLAKLVPPLSSVEYAVCPQAMDVWASPSPSSCEIRPSYLHKYRSTPVVQISTPGVKLLPSSLCPSGCSLTFHPPDSSFTLGDLLTHCLHVLVDADHISTDFVRSLGHGFCLGNLVPEEMSPAFTELVRFVAENFGSDLLEAFIQHLLLLCAPSGSTEQGSCSNGPEDKPSNPGDDGENPGDNSGQNVPEDKGKGKDQDRRNECDCTRLINGLCCQWKCCHDLKFELQNKLYQLNMLKESLNNQKVTNQTKEDLLHQKILKVQEQMEDLEMLKRLCQLLQTDIEACKLSGQRAHNPEASEKEGLDQYQKKGSDQQDQQKKGSEQDQQKKGSEQDQQKWKKWRMSWTPSIFALVVFKRTAALRGSKLIASFFMAGSKPFSSVAASPLPPTEIIQPGYDFGRDPFGPAYGIQVPNGSDGLPKFVNWLDVPGAVSQSKNQLQCEAGYIIAGLGGISSLNYLENKSRILLSAQHILDGNTVTNHGCEGGWPENVFDFIIRNGGVVSETDYPYRGFRGPCKAVEAPGVSIANWAAVEPTEEAVKYALAYQPVVASIYTNRHFRRYTEGLLKVPYRHGPVNHSVLLIGYDETPELGEFWVGMNSARRRWGMKWGRYCNIFFIPRNTLHVRGAVGVLSKVLLPLRASLVPKVKTRSESCPACFK